ncbi:poly(R)-hydroxyalkanoic acid synthase subunit PhaE [Qipengyuania sp. DSG2-2]|uniref:poly(R)-hydroxyalkanoic acid synthase subunit PhaE n=1 Tax=Qipengyuania sp. DGS2-2 TaxID=3349631 RepID=UPI0036D321EC
MADKSETGPIIDPAAQFNTMLAEWEKMTNSISESITGTKEFSQAVNQSNAMQMQMRAQIQKAMGKALEVANLPSREDIITLGERVGAIEGQLARIEAAIGTDLKPADTARKPKPKRTRKPPETA